MKGERGRAVSGLYTFIKKGARIIHFSKHLKQSPKEIIERSKKENLWRGLPDLYDPELDIRVESICGRPVLCMIHHEQTKKAIMYMVGGGFVKAPRHEAIQRAVRMAKIPRKDVFIPYYPLCTDYPVSRAYDMVLETYRFLLEQYAPEDICFLGTSAGGTLALGLIAHMNATGSDLPKPKEIFALSPGTCPKDKAEYRLMKAHDSTDFMIPAKFLRTMEKLMRHGSDTVKDYMVYLRDGDYTDCPPVRLVYADTETLYGGCPGIEAALKKYGVSYQKIVGKGMFHCYPIYLAPKESLEANGRLMERLAAC